MEVVDNKALVLHTKTPHLITEAIKKSHVLSREGDVYKVLVNWELPEAQQLSHLKLANVPSPINRDYKWTGRLTPFKHQEVTSSFLTLHKKSILL